MIIDICPRNACFSNYQLDFTFSIFFYTLLFLYFSIFLEPRTKVLWHYCPTKPPAINTLQYHYCCCDLSEMFLFNLGLVGRSLELSIILHGLFSTDFGIFRGSISKLSIRSLRVFLYLLKIAIISVFFFIFSITCWKIFFLRIVLI